MSRRNVKLLLLALIALDVLYPAVIFLAPQMWTHFLHGVRVEDTLGLLHRLGTGWAAFAVVQIVAYRRWEREPGWLMACAAVRWTEVGADWVYLGFSQHISLFGTVVLASATPVNVICGWLFYRSYLRYARGGSEAGAVPAGA